MTFTTAAPRCGGKPGFAPLRNPQHRSITEIPEHKGASQDGAAPNHVLLGTSCPQWGQAWVRVPDGHIPAVGTPALSTPQGPADPPSSNVSNRAVPAIPWQPHSWGISQPQAAGSSIFSPLCWRLSRLRQQRHPRSPPGQGWSQQQQHRLGWSREQLAQPREGGREDGGDQNRHVHVFSWRETTFPAGSAKGTSSRDTRELLCSRGISSRTMWGSNVSPGSLGSVREEKHGISALD